MQCFALGPEDFRLFEGENMEEKVPDERYVNILLGEFSKSVRGSIAASRSVKMDQLKCKLSKPPGGSRNSHREEGG